MTSTKINESVVTQRVLWVKQMLDSIRDLPVSKKEVFFQNKHNIAAAESYLRRALEALFDLGRHILVKRFAFPATEYKEIATGLFKKNVITQKDSSILRQMAGYRNRMVHFYQEITPEELLDICTHNLDEIEMLLARLVEWVKTNKEAK